MLKKLVAVIAAVVMVLAMGVTAFADNESPQQTNEIIPTQGTVTDAAAAAQNAGDTVLWTGEITGTVSADQPGIVTITISGDLSQYSRIYLAYMNEATGKWDYSDGTRNGNTVSFAVQHTCPAVVFGVKASDKPTPAPSPAPSGQGGKTSPATGSSTNAAVYALLAGVLAVAAVGFAMRKRNA